MATIYGPTPLAVAQPRRYFFDDLKLWVGIGGSITIVNTPPTLPVSYTIPEATAEQYEKLKHLHHLVTIVKNESHGKHSAATQPNTGVDQ